MEHSTQTRPTSGECRSWYAVQAKATHEKRVASLLEYQQYEWFLPLYACRRKWSDRIKEVEVPLFPGYVFCRFAMHARASILKTPSVLHIVGIGGTPTPIDQSEILSIQKVVQAGIGVSPHPFLGKGRRVRIDGGSLDGVEGIIQEVRQKRRLIVSVTMLQRSVSVDIDSACVTPIFGFTAEKRCPLQL